MGILYLIFWAVLFVLTITTAQKNDRSVLVWSLVGLIFSPLLSLIALLLIGKRHDWSSYL